MIRLELPNVKYKNTYIHAIKEFQKLGSDNESTDHYLKHDLNKLEKSFDTFVQKLLDARTYCPKPTWVKSTQYWIINKNDKYCGRISLRHTLNRPLSKQGGHIGYDIIPSERGKSYASIALGLCLNEAKKMGFKKVLITCDNHNLASIKTIEKNNGIFQDEVKQKSGVITRRYWIIIK